MDMCIRTGLKLSDDHGVWRKTVRLFSPSFSLDDGEKENANVDDPDRKKFTVAIKKNKK